MKYLIKTYFGTATCYKETDSLSLALSQIFTQEQIDNLTDEQITYYSNYGVSCKDVEDGSLSGGLLCVKGNKVNNLSAKSYWYMCKWTGNMRKETRRGIGSPAEKSNYFNKDVAVNRLRKMKLDKFLND